MIKGKVWKFKDNIDTDLIIPARYLNTTNPHDLAKHCMEDADPEFSKKISKGDIIVAGENFGCGSSREHAPISIKAAGISAAVAKSFARIFYRNSINIGLPIFESTEAVDDASQGDELEINIDTGQINNLTKNKKYKAELYPEFMQGIIKAGGLINYVRGKIKNA